MPKTKEKPIDVMDEKSQSDQQLIQSEDEQKEAMRVQSLFRASWEAKQVLELTETWKKCDDYVNSRQGDPQSADDPNSTTNIIKPIIDGQIADLVSKPYNVGAKGQEMSDNLYSVQVEHMMQFILDRNKFKVKLNLGERDRLELGTSIYKIYFDEDELEGRGLPMMDGINPANFFPDPKVISHHRFQEGEFAIHAVPRPLSWFRKKFKERGKYVKRQVSIPYDPQIYEDDNADLTNYITSARALCIECYERDEEGNLYCLTVANNILLDDTRTRKEKVQRRDKYPFVVIPCYTQRGTIWGKGDVEFLIPTQDIINELDDQIRINARLMGNPQIVVGMGAGKGFDFRKWTSKPGLRIPMRDQTAFQVVTAQPVSRDVVQRREKGFEEADTISGRYNVNRGDVPGAGVTAASAIMALQQAGQKTVVHKQIMFKAGYAEVLELLYDEMTEHWTEEIWIRVEGTEPDYKFYDPRKLTQVPMMIPNAAAGPNEDGLTQLSDKQGKPMTRDACFDFTLFIGDGFPDDPTFQYQSMMDFAKISIGGMPLVTWNELRKFIRDKMGFDLDNDDVVKQQMQPPAPPPGMPGAPPGAPMGAPPGPPQGLPPNVVPMPQQGGAMNA